MFLRSVKGKSRLIRQGMSHTSQAAKASHKMKFFIKDVFSKCDQIRSLMRIWSHLLKKSLMENFIFWTILTVFGNPGYAFVVLCMGVISFFAISFLSIFYLNYYFTAQKKKFSIKDFDFCSKYDQICSFLRIWSHLLKKFLRIHWRLLTILKISKKVFNVKCCLICKSVHILKAYLTHHTLR